MTLPLTKIARVSFWVAALVAFVFAVLPTPPQLPGAPGDKVNHILAFATLGVLGTFGYRQVAPVRLLAGLAIFGGLIELVQLAPELNRDGDAVDWLVDMVAASLAVAATRFLIARPGS